MAFFGADFQDFTYKSEYVKANVHFSKFGGRFRLAAIWLDRTFMEKMKPVVPYKTGKFLSRLEAANAGGWGMGRIVTSSPPQGRYLYGGISRSGKPFRWTNPLTQPRWGQWTYQTYQQEFNEGIKHIITTGRYK